MSILLNDLLASLAFRPSHYFLYLALLLTPMSASEQKAGEPGQAELGPMAEQPLGTGQSELAYFLAQQDRTKTAGCTLRALSDELQKKYAADPNADLREQIRDQAAFVNKLRDLRPEAKKYVDPTLQPTLDWLVRDAEERVSSLKTELTARLRAPNPDKIALKGQIEKLQKEIDRNTNLAKTLADKIKSIQDDHRREGVASELDALTKDGNRVVNLDREKEH